MIYERAVEEAMREFSHGVPSLRFTGTHGGRSYADWEHAIMRELRESKYSTPRCTRPRQWDVDARIEEVNKKLD